MQTALTPHDLTVLIGLIRRGEKVAPARDIESGTKRLRNNLGMLLGTLYKEDYLERILKSADLHEAEKALKSAMDRLGNGLPKPVTMPERSMPQLLPPRRAAPVPEQKENTPMAAEKKAAPKAPKEPKAKSLPASKDPGVTRGRQSGFEGKFLFPKVETNPRREGVPGHTSMGLILKKPGITTKEFLDKGGRLEDLRWDVKKGHVEARDER